VRVRLRAAQGEAAHLKRDHSSKDTELRVPDGRNRQSRKQHASNDKDANLYIVEVDVAEMHRPNSQELRSLQAVHATSQVEVI
jgi:hypothetical protein